MINKRQYLKTNIFSTNCVTALQFLRSITFHDSSHKHQIEIIVVLDSCIPLSALWCQFNCNIYTILLYIGQTFEISMYSYN